MEKLDPQLRICSNSAARLRRSRGPQGRSRRPQWTDPSTSSSSSAVTSPISRLWASFPTSRSPTRQRATRSARGHPVGNLEQFSRTQHVVLASAPSPIKPLLNYSADEIGALAIHKRTTVEPLEKASSSA